MTNEQPSREEVSRRGVLKGTAALASTAALTGEAGAYRDAFDFPLPVAQNNGEGRTFTLVGIVGGWLGVAPYDIDAASNPPLRLIEGEEHEVIWVNGDGAAHNFNITDASPFDEDAEILEVTETVTEQGAFTSIRFTADERMAEYFCQPHPAQMRGPVELIDPGDVHELVVNVEDENGDPLGAEVFLDDMHAFSDLAARPDPFQEEGESEASEELEPGGDGNESVRGNESARENVTTTGNESARENVTTTGNESTPGNESEGTEETGGGQDGEVEEAPAIARFDLLENGEYDLEVWTYGHERVTDTVTIDGDDQEITVTLPALEPGEPTETYSLRLEEGQWVGLGPDSIADETNPTLEFEADETYEVEWENAIGRLEPEGENRTFEPLPGHNFVIASDGETNQWDTYVRSDFSSEEGETQSVSFVAREPMDIYLDQSQLDAVGEVVVDGEGTETATETGDAVGNETVDNETVTNETVTNETVTNETDDGY